VAVSYIVEVRYTGADWSDLMADIRSWLDRRQIEHDKFEHSMVGRGITERVGFRDEVHATALAPSTCQYRSAECE
jgi:hypothetical protein